MTVVGDASANDIVVSADASGNLQVTNNGSAVAISTTFGTPTNANLKTLSVDARNGNDSILIDKSLNVLDANGKLVASSNGTLPRRWRKRHDYRAIRRFCGRRGG